MRSADLPLAVRREAHGSTDLVWATPTPALVDHPLLDDAELTRCAGYHQVADQARHATGRVAAKQEAGRLLEVDPARVSVRPEAGATAGRPRLHVDGKPVGLTLSIAHAGEVVLLALAPAACGVDVERTIALHPLLNSDLVFSVTERARLARLPEADRLALAASWWTAKEAVLKATGHGLYEDPATIDVSNPLVLAGGHTWCWEELAAPEGYRASLAVSTESAEPAAIAPPGRHRRR